MPKQKLYYGLNKPSKGRRNAGIKQSFQANQVKRWGLYGINPATFNKYHPSIKSRLIDINEKVKKQKPKTKKEISEIVKKMDKNIVTVPHPKYDFLKQKVNVNDEYITLNDLYDDYGDDIYIEDFENVDFLENGDEYEYEDEDEDEYEVIGEGEGDVVPEGDFSYVREGEFTKPDEDDFYRVMAGDFPRVMEGDFIEKIVDDDFVEDTELTRLKTEIYDYYNQKYVPLTKYEEYEIMRRLEKAVKYYEEKGEPLTQEEKINFFNFEVDRLEERKNRNVGYLDDILRQTENDDFEIKRRLERAIKYYEEKGEPLTEEEKIDFFNFMEEYKNRNAPKYLDIPTALKNI